MDNDEVAQRFDVTPQRILERTGIRPRHDDILRRLLETLRPRRLLASAVEPESRLREDLDLDSIGQVEAIVLVEEAF